MSGNKLETNLQILEDKAIVELIGSIDEDSDFEKVLSVTQAEYRFDFDKVTMINSCGIREWISFVEKLPEDARIFYENCPQIIIEQINMVHGFIRKGAVIESLYAPYYCESCDTEEKIHLKVADIQDKKAPEVKCPHCDAANMEFDAIEEQYFNFLTTK